jgi:cation transport ATPase
MKYLILCLLLIGCGSRKVELSKSEKETQTDITEHSTVNLEYKTDRMTLEPFNPDRAILINGKQYENTKIVIEREEGLKQTETNKEDKSESKEETKDKTTERDNTTLFIWLGLGGLLLILLFMFFAMMFMFKNISSKIPTIPKI